MAPIQASFHQDCDAEHIIRKHQVLRSVWRGGGMNKNGFTLIEILIGLVVIGVLSVIVVGKINGAQDAATTVRCLADIDAFATDVDAQELLVHPEHLRLQ
jgi:prepilin-type N-terminal cleavage/methylation domain-containing protein